jgi:hypothetical protein
MRVYDVCMMTTPSVLPFLLLRILVFDVVILPMPACRDRAYDVYCTLPDLPFAFRFSLLWCLNSCAS